MDYKETLLLPKTTFAMRGNLAQNEPKRYASWYERDVYTKMKTKRKDATESFTLHDGPPYANGHTHIGHALNKTLKDIIVKFNYFNGKSVRFTPGWDCHGLPIEQQVEKKLGSKAKKEALSTAEVRQLCREHAAKFVGIQRDEFKQLGIIADWEKPYLTMDYAFEANIFRTLCDVASKGLLIERSKPVYWSWAERTALAEAEVEYADKEDYSIYVAFELDDNSKQKLGVDKAALVIWTTTPWTLPANTGISLKPEEKYILTSSGHIIASARHESLLAEGIVSESIEKEFTSTELENLIAINPLNGRNSHVVLGEHVLMDGGSGAVHTAPGHGEDDYRVGLIYNLDVVMPVDERGCYDETIVHEKLLPEAESFVGTHVFKANEKILEFLGSALLKQNKFVHSYPHCWRSKTPLIYRATKQWFISVDAVPESENRTLRNIATHEIGETKFIPATGHNRIGTMVENRPDWCISRQRDWGVPIALFRHKITGEPVLDEKVLNFTAMIFEQRGTDVWFSMSIEQLLYPGSGYKAEELEKVEDILDVWFDSGSTWKAVLKSRNYDAGSYPADLYLEGSDQHRGWFQSSLFLSTAVEHQAPYKAVLTHGFTVDDKGEKMSKSKGNVVAPDKVLKEYGSEILRLWVATSDYQNDLKISNAILKQTSEQYRKLRNTFRFLLANVNDLEKISEFEEMSVVDNWILARSYEVFNEAHEAFDAYDFVKAMSLLNNYIVNELSGIYMDLCKDRLYCDDKNSSHRRASQSAMALIVRSLLGLIAPVLTYTADEILEHAPAIIRGDVEDIFDYEYVKLPEVKSDFDAQYMIDARDKFSEVVDVLKKEKTIKSTLELELFTNSKIIEDIDSIEAEDWFMVSGVKYKPADSDMGSFELNGDRFYIVKAQAHKCPRCWKFSADKEDVLCKRCDEVMNAK